MSGEDTARARLLGEVGHLGAAIVTLEALVTEAYMRLVALGRTADRHAEALGSSQIHWVVGREMTYWLKCGDLLLL